MTDSRRDGVITYVGVAHPWMCDTMGHMNVRHYMAMFDDASFQLLGRLTGVEKDRSLGWADVRHEIEYRHETPAGTLITIRSQVTRIGRTSVTYRHVMAGSLEGELHAEATVTSVRFDLVARKSLAVDADLRQRAERLLLDTGSSP
ncbi:acyl-CoA thioesterase [Mesorhizobium sp. YM1C-6-2]|uniref:acyl-CoA thioesterase n=1 Tax=Mesorhizobium sp. YM1C-6-2 TaxID=1827501 RepID=UPI0026D920ED